MLKSISLPPLSPPGGTPLTELNHVQFSPESQEWITATATHQNLSSDTTNDNNLMVKNLSKQSATESLIVTFNKGRTTNIYFHFSTWGNASSVWPSEDSISLIPNHLLLMHREICFECSGVVSLWMSILRISDHWWISRRGNSGYSLHVFIYNTALMENSDSPVWQNESCWSDITFIWTIQFFLGAQVMYVWRVFYLFILSQEAENEKTTIHPHLS